MRPVAILLTTLLPPRLRSAVLRSFCGYVVPPSSRIGLSWISCERLVLGEHASIGHLNVCRRLELLQLGDRAHVGALNWITCSQGLVGDAMSEKHWSRSLVVGNHAALTTRHYLDCTDRIEIGNFSTVAGVRSVFLTSRVHPEGRRSSAPIRIGRYCFIGNSCVVVAGAVLPDASVLAARSLLKSGLTESLRLYAGTPARAKKALSEDSVYFSRAEGIVY